MGVASWLYASSLASAADGTPWKFSDPAFQAVIAGRSPRASQGKDQEFLEFVSDHLDDESGCCGPLPGGHDIVRQVGSMLGFHKMPGFSPIFYGAVREWQAPSWQLREDGRKARIHVGNIILADRLILSTCPAASALAAFTVSDHLILQMLPVASSASNVALWKSTMEMLEIFIELGEGAMRKARSAGASCCSSYPSPLWSVLLASSRWTHRLLHLLGGAFREPWLPTGDSHLRAWLREPLVLAHFQAIGRPSIIVGDTHIDFPLGLELAHQYGYKNKKGGVGSSAVATRQAFADVHLVLKQTREYIQRVTDSGSEGVYWPIKGTALLMLRHGTWHGALADGKVDMVDRDMDFAIACSKAETWFVAVDFITTALMQRRGWAGCIHHTVDWYLPKSGPEGTAWNTGSNSSSSAKLDGRGTAVLTCSRMFPKENAWVVFELIWMHAVVLDAPRGRGGSDRAAASDPCSTCVGSVPSVDHGCESNALGPEVHTMSSFYARQSVDWSSLQFRGLLVIGSNPVCEIGHGLPTRCYLARSYPYQCWDGGLPLSCLLPLARCGAYNVSMPCARCARSELKWFNNGKYWARLPGRPCLALPLISADESGKLNGDRLGYDERNRRLVREGITSADVEVLQDRGRWRRARGFDAFGPADFAECAAPDAAGDRPAVVRLSFASI